MPISPFVVKFPFELVVAFPPTQKLFDTESCVVEAPPDNVDSAATDNVLAPVRLMLPKPEAMEPDPKAPTEVSDDPVTSEPKAVSERTDVLLIKYERPEAKLMSFDT